MILKEYSNIKKDYKKYFLEELEKIILEIDNLKPSDITGDAMEDYSHNNKGKIWQSKILDYFEKHLQKEIKVATENIKKDKLTYNCAKCGTCCKFACSQFSPQELKQKAEKGDTTAKEFLETFEIYKNKKIPKKIYPEYIEFLENFSDKKYFIYHCPRVTDKNMCSCYEKRPNICRNFPDSPIEFLPIKCSYAKWKKHSLEKALRIKAKTEICNFYTEKIKGLQ